jgi:hypothetical protein
MRNYLSADRIRLGRNGKDALYDDWLVGAVPGAIARFILAALSFCVVAVLLKIEQNTRPQ